MAIAPVRPPMIPTASLPPSLILDLSELEEESALPAPVVGAAEGAAETGDARLKDRESVAPP